MSEPDAKRPKVERELGYACLKPEYIKRDTSLNTARLEEFDDEAKEGEGLERLNSAKTMGNVNMANKQKKRGQNKNRQLSQEKEAVRFCEREKTEQQTCVLGEKCHFEHDLEKYLSSKPKDLEGVCPVFDAIGYCPSGVKCRWLSSHFKDGNLVEKENVCIKNELNRITPDLQHKLQKRKYDLSRAETCLAEIEKGRVPAQQQEGQDNEQGVLEKAKENEAAYVETKFHPSEKKFLNYRNVKVLSPLTTVGNLPYRRLMKTLGAEVTFSEMALCLPLIQGAKSEWALTRAHSTEKGSFVAQVATSKPWQAVKAAQILSELTKDISEINLNSGCPIDLLCRQGAGCALMENNGRVMKILKGMNAVSGEIPISVKVRIGLKDKHPTAKSLVNRIVDDNLVGAITLHGRSGAQRYTKEADWQYISEVAQLVKDKRQDLDVKPYVIGNGDIYTHLDWYNHIENQNVDTCMVARGALIKPWIFEEIEGRQYMDKSATERLEYIKQFAHYGLSHWGSDQYGVSVTRRFLCEWLSFTSRYIPIGLLERLPPKLNERPPPYTGRNELETLLASTDYTDWIKISEMFLGPATSFNFTPKHKSNSYAV